MANLDSSLSRAPQAKSIFASKTFWGAIFTTVAAVAPIVGDAVDNRKLSGKEAAQIVVIMAGAAATVVGRVKAEAPVYTPHGLPGPNKEDLGPSQLSDPSTAANTDQYYGSPLPEVSLPQSGREINPSTATNTDQYYGSPLPEVSLPQSDG